MDVRRGLLISEDIYLSGWLDDGWVMPGGGIERVPIAALNFLRKQ